MRTIPKLAATGLAAMLALSVAPPADAGAQELARIYRFSPQNGGTFEAALQKHVSDRIEHDDPWGWMVMEVVAGENYGDFIVRSGSHTWADFDAYDQGFGAESGLHFQVSVAPLVEDVESWITEEDTANSRLPTDAEWPDIELIEVITYHVKPGQQQRFDELVGTVHGAIEASDWPVRYAWVDHVAGLGGPRKTLAIFFEDWAGFEEPETPMYEMLQDELGEDEAQSVMEDFGQTYRYVESSILRWRRGLSVPPPDMRGEM